MTLEQTEVDDIVAAIHVQLKENGDKLNEKLLRDLFRYIVLETGINILVGVDVD